MRRLEVEILPGTIPGTDPRAIRRVRAIAGDVTLPLLTIAEGAEQLVAELVGALYEHAAFTRLMATTDIAAILEAAS